MKEEGQSPALDPIYWIGSWATALAGSWGGAPAFLKAPDY